MYFDFWAATWWHIRRFEMYSKRGNVSVVFPAVVMVVVVMGGWFVGMLGLTRFSDGARSVHGVSFVMILFLLFRFFFLDFLGHDARSLDRSFE